LVGCPVSIEVDNRRILVGTKAREGFGAGITVLVNNENAILELAALVVDGSTSRFAQYRSWVYQPQPSGLGIYALEDSNIVGRGFVTELSQLRGVRATRVGVLIAAREDELVILDISDPTRPKVQSTTKAADAASYLAMDVVSR